MLPMLDETDLAGALVNGVHYYTDGTTVFAECSEGLETVGPLAAAVSDIRTALRAALAPVRAPWEAP